MYFGTQTQLSVSVRSGHETSSSNFRGHRIVEKPDAHSNPVMRAICGSISMCQWKSSSIVFQYPGAALGRRKGRSCSDKW